LFTLVFFRLARRTNIVKGAHCDAACAPARLFISRVAALAPNNRRIEDRQTLEREVEAWLSRRNGSQAKADWRFTTDAARIKLKRVYPAF
jgi:hypothetical protein